MRGLGGETGSGWLTALRLYLGLMLVSNLAWEFGQMPLYTLWVTDTAAEIVFAGLHCTAGDLLIALAALVTALVLLGRADWPRRGFWPVALAAGAIGLGYAVFSEWLNIEVRQAWAYRPAMPVLPVLGTGLAPLAQWVVVPGLAFLVTSRCVLDSRRSAHADLQKIPLTFHQMEAPPSSSIRRRFTFNHKAPGKVSAFGRIRGEEDT